MNIIISNFPYGQVVAQATAADLEAIARVFASAKKVESDYIGGDYGYAYFAEEQKKISSLRIEILTEKVLTKDAVERLRSLVESEKEKQD